MKKNLLLCLIAAGSMSLFATPLAAAPDVSAKILKAFRTHFPEVSNPSIFHSGNTYTVSFKTSDSATSGRIFYDAEGDLTETILYYGAEELCPFIRSKIVSKYKDKKIYSVTEVQNDSEHFYHVILENANGLMVLRVDHDGTMHVEKKYKKSA